MSIFTIYHGSNIVIEKPLFHYEGSNKHNDYGLGFYCTLDIEMAKEWANRNINNGFVNKYSFNDEGLRILDLSNKSKYSVLNWIAILIHYRDLSLQDRIDYQKALSFLEKYFINVEDYDVVIGYRADDAYFRFPLMFIQNVITFDKLEEIYQLGNLGKQYVLISQKAFSRIHFKGVIPCEPIYHDRYINRVKEAVDLYHIFEIQDRYSKGKRIIDLMQEDND